MTPRPRSARNRTEQQERMFVAVAALQAYMASYDDQYGYMDYTDKTFIDDVLYGLGVALGPEYQYADGFERFKERLREHLK